MRTWFRKALRHSLISALVKVCDKENKLPRCNRECLDPCTCHNIHHCQRRPVYYEMHKSLICGGHKGFLYREIMRMTVAAIAECFMEITAACCSFIAVASDGTSVWIILLGVWQCAGWRCLWLTIPWEVQCRYYCFFFSLCVLSLHLFFQVSEGTYPMSECVNMCLYGPC